MLKAFTKYQNIIVNTQVEYIGASAILDCISKGDLGIYVAIQLVVKDSEFDSFLHFRGDALTSNEKLV